MGFTFPTLRQDKCSQGGLRLSTLATKIVPNTSSEHSIKSASNTKNTFAVYNLVFVSWLQESFFRFFLAPGSLLAFQSPNQIWKTTSTCIPRDTIETIESTDGIQVIETIKAIEAIEAIEAIKAIKASKSSKQTKQRKSEAIEPAKRNY